MVTPRLTWRKSTYSSNQGAGCVELAPTSPESAPVKFGRAEVGREPCGLLLADIYKCWWTVLRVPVDGQGLCRQADNEGAGSEVRFLA
ncbi:DUF397 domain-containing protein [Spirillospora sp. NPDC048819]|uniref:DUF397 domain-containing protein n=1 Tax=Spirillospora sp. NPDC048819 TaxID=3155268 RepID=UPI00340E07DD